MPDYMEEESFTLPGESGNFLRITFAQVYGFPESTCAWGGYEVRATAEIKSDGFAVAATLWTSTGELSKLFQQLRRCQAAVAGVAQYESYEHQLSFNISYQAMGQVIIGGRFSDNCNTLEFEFPSDQSFMQSTLAQLQQIVSKYGNMKGMRQA